MTRDERAKLKAIDMDILSAALALQHLLIDRAAIDPMHTIDLLNGIAETLRQAVHTATPIERKTPRG